MSQAKKLLRASYELCRHARTNETILRTVGYTLPAVLRLHVNSVSLASAFTSTHLPQQVSLNRPSEDAAQENAALGDTVYLQSRNPKLYYFAPAFLRWLYRLITTAPAGADRNKLWIAGFANQNPSQKDQVPFMRKYRFDASAGASTLAVVPVNGGVNNESRPGGRGNYDTENSPAMTYPTPVIYYTTAGEGEIVLGPYPAHDDQYLQWLLSMTNLPTIPQTISMPYSTKEPNLPRAYANTVRKLFMGFGSRGASVLVPSGDDGVGRPHGRNKSASDRFYIVFPTSCTCGVLPLLAGCTQASVQATHRALVICRSLCHLCRWYDSF